MILDERGDNSAAKKGGSCYLSVKDVPKIEMPMIWRLCAPYARTPNDFSSLSAGLVGKVTVQPSISLGYGGVNAKRRLVGRFHRWNHIPENRRSRHDRDDTADDDRHDEGDEDQYGIIAILG